MSDTEPDKDFLDGEDDLPAFEQWELPNTGLQGLWESVETEEGSKARMLGYVYIYIYIYIYICIHMSVSPLHSYTSPLL